MKKLMLTIAVAAIGLLAQGCVSFTRTTSKPNGVNSTTHLTTQSVVNFSLVPSKAR